MTAHATMSPGTAVLTAPVGADGPEIGARGFATCALTGNPQATGVARHFARSTLQGWDMPFLIEDVEIIVSEMLSNAIRHGLPTACEQPVRPRLVGLGLLRRGETVLCAVSDPSSEVPVVREPDQLAESGRGLRLIDSLSQSWGWTPNRCGKSVWATVSAGLPC
ncbi:ATP-binding protein [Streptomyces sp. NPDC092296]|uniref:ATP-binding protein n=1 Tax=Streptomyces sp. NPDC092296 TaxID=3366012 RepID=UPI0037F9F693